MKKPDRFERMLIKRAQRMRLPFEPKADNLDQCGISSYEAVQLLRAEHAWMRVCIKTEESRVKFGDSADYKRGAEAMVFALLKRLDQRRK